MNSDIKIFIPESAPDLEKYYRLRYEVLRKPWGRPEHETKDEWEEKSIHLLATDKSGNAIAVGRLQLNSSEEAQIRSMAVNENYRGKGLGSLMLHRLEQIAGDKKIKQIILDSRNTAVDFYLKNGYEVEGDSYVLFGVIPHFRMSKKI